MSFVWTFTTGSSLLASRLACWPIIPGSIVIIADDGNPAHYKELIDNGDGTLSGDGNGVVDYSYGMIEINFSSPLPDSGTEILANYDSREGGCVDACGKCATNKLRLNLSPGAISGQGDIAVSDAWIRLLDKIQRDVLPYHVELITNEYTETYLWQVGHRFDIIPSDEEPVDSAGLRLVFDSTDW